MTSRLPIRFVLAAMLVLVLSGCAGHKPETVSVPPPPAINQPASPGTSAASSTTSPSSTGRPASRSHDENDENDENEAAIRIPSGKQPILVQTGVASWYGPPYHNRRSSNGEVYDMHAFTAAHRTLPMGSIVRVTNVRTGHSTLVRITDRGPFIEGRMLDLSLAAAKKVDVWAAGLATVRMEVLETPAPLETGGRWAVQIGGFEGEDAADKLKDHLTHRYQNAKVLCFSSPTGDWWIRVRVQADDRRRAEDVARETRTPEGAIFLVRLD
jgi:rare lipoprotein A